MRTKIRSTPCTIYTTTDDAEFRDREEFGLFDWSQAWSVYDDTAMLAGGEASE